MFGPPLRKNKNICTPPFLNFHLTPQTKKRFDPLQNKKFGNFSKHRPSGPMLSISQNVRMSVRVSVCSLLRYRLNVFLPPLPKVGYPKILEIRNPWGKVMERIGLRYEHFLFGSGLKKVFFLLILPYKTCWKLCFPMDERPMVEGYIANFGITLDVFEFFAFWIIFSVIPKFLGFWLFLVHPTVVLVLLCASVERCFVSRMRDFFLGIPFYFFFFFFYPNKKIPPPLKKNVLMVLLHARVKRFSVSRMHDFFWF